MTAPPSGTTHEVTNQPPPLPRYDVFGSDRALREGVSRHAAGWANESLSELGRLAGSPAAQQWAALANEFPPRLRSHDRYGHRIDEVEFHPSWHRLLEVAIGRGLHAAPYRQPGRPGAHVARATGFFVWSQVESGHGCPVSMTYAAVPVLSAEPALAAEWLPRLTSYSYDPTFRPPAAKAGCLAGMGMTEKQGGSDVRANSTRAVATPDGSYRLTGHKWFTSAPMSDVFLVLAQAPAGLTCFLVPRVLPDGSRNRLRLQRLKEKLGNRSNASAEPEFLDTLGWRVGPEGRGVPSIIKMVNLTRLDCVIGSAALMRQALTQAIHHAAHRRAFGERLVDLPLMRNVLADLAVEAEAATALMLRLAAAVDAGENALLRLALPVAKYWVTKRCGPHVGEALECLGGNGYVEESGLPRLFREAPLNSIWEGSGNVIALDVLRAVASAPDSVEAFRAEVHRGAGGDARLDRASAELGDQLLDPADPAAARRLAEHLAVVLQAALLVRFAPPAVADAYCAGRLGADAGRAFGTLPSGLDLAAVLDRAAPERS